MPDDFTCQCGESCPEIGNIYSVQKVNGYSLKIVREQGVLKMF